MKLIMTKKRVKEIIQEEIQSFLEKKKAEKEKPEEITLEKNSFMKMIELEVQKALAGE
jgi:hypothetical protein